MVKFIMSIGNETFSVLSDEAKNRDVTVQQLLRAVVVPDWIKDNMPFASPSNGSPQLHSSINKTSEARRPSTLVSPAARLSQ